ncbi:TetR/AcrR family transcriptional regulator [Eubacterium barkeri]|uniref:Regulatory protein, tetR family n=1 Tax=Eubacterium barkeri TaxID=1528 RepID=A0A1H3AQD2_EUBBA|nr:TetR/AcrR family transcriptional regulator [Eubacterium barkeri]SDX31611.1 regulatory protein, tetR family [Eubacterium barkeri]
MAYTKGQETKNAFVLMTYKKLTEQNASTLTVRQLAGELGYSPAVLYRYFDSLEEVVVVASVRFLNQYMMEYARLLDSDLDLLEVYIEGWQLFNSHAFERPDIYYGLFWGEYNNVFENAIAEYFEIFPFSGSDRFLANYYTIAAPILLLWRECWRKV